MDLALIEGTEDLRKVPGGHNKRGPVSRLNLCDKGFKLAAADVSGLSGKEGGAGVSPLIRHLAREGEGSRNSDIPRERESMGFPHLCQAISLTSAMREGKRLRGKGLRR